jgi:hypothetical protein
MPWLNSPVNALTSRKQQHTAGYPRTPTSHATTKIAAKQAAVLQYHSMETPRTVTFVVVCRVHQAGRRQALEQLRVHGLVQCGRRAALQSNRKNNAVSETNISWSVKYNQHHCKVTASKQLSYIHCNTAPSPGSSTWKSVLPQPRMNSASPVNTRDMSSSAYDTQPCSDTAQTMTQLREDQTGL